MSSSVNGGHAFLTLSRFTFLWIRDFPNTGHKQSRGQRLTEASLALEWDWVMDSQPSRWGGTLHRLERLISGSSWRDQAVWRTQERTLVPKRLLGDRRDMAASGDEEGWGHRCGALQPTSVYPRGRGSLAATDVRWTLPATRDKNTVMTQSQQANVPRKLAVSLRRKLVSGEPYRDMNATWHSEAQVLLTWRGKEPAGTSQRIEPEGAWAALRTKKTSSWPWRVFRLLAGRAESAPMAPSCSWTCPGLAQPAPHQARGLTALSSQRDRGRGRLCAPGPSGRGRIPSASRVSSSAARWEASGWAPGLTPATGTREHLTPEQPTPVPFREGTRRWHSFERVSPPSFAPHVQWEELS